jgi:hypothetical protein
MITIEGYTLLAFFVIKLRDSPNLQQVPHNDQYLLSLSFSTSFSLTLPPRILYQAHFIFESLHLLPAIMAPKSDLVEVKFRFAGPPNTPKKETVSCQWPKRAVFRDLLLAVLSEHLYAHTSRNDVELHPPNHHPSFRVESISAVDTVEICIRKRQWE